MSAFGWVLIVAIILIVISIIIIVIVVVSGNSTTAGTGSNDQNGNKNSLAPSGTIVTATTKFMLSVNNKVVYSTPNRINSCGYRVIINDTAPVAPSYQRLTFELDNVDVANIRYGDDVRIRFTEPVIPRFMTICTNDSIVSCGSPLSATTGIPNLWTIDGAATGTPLRSGDQIRLKLKGTINYVTVCTPSPDSTTPLTLNTAQQSTLFTLAALAS